MKIPALVLAPLLAATLSGAQQLHLERKLEASSPITYATTCADGTELLGTGKDGELYLWTGGSSSAHQLKIDGRATQVACSSDGRWIAAGLGDGAVLLIGDSGHVSQRLEVTKHDLGSISFSPDSTLLTVGANDSPTQLWDVRTGKRIAVGNTSFAASTATAFSPDGKSYISADEDTTIRVYSSKGEPLYSTEADRLEPFAAAYTPDGKKFAIAGAGGAISLFDAATGHKLKTSENRGNPIFKMMMSPDGRQVAALEFDDFTFEPLRISLWNIGTNDWSKTTLDPKSVIGAGADKNHLLIIKSEAPGTISLWSLQ